MIRLLPLPFDSTEEHQQSISSGKPSKIDHSYRNLGDHYFSDTQVEYVPNARLVLFNKELAQQLKLDLPECDKQIEQFMLKNFAWFKYDKQNNDRPKSTTTKTFFSTRYQDSEDKSEGSALGDGRAIWVGEIINTLESGRLQYLDVVLKGTGATALAWLNHPKESHRDGQLSLSEAVHEYIYCSAAKANGISTAGILAVIELPFYREIDNEKAAIVVRIGNHLRFAHYCYFTDNPIQLKTLFEYGLKRDMGLSLTHRVIAKDARNYLDFIAANLASDAAVYFDIHAVHGSPTFGNITSCGRTIDFSTFVYIDAHHGKYSYMPNGVNFLGGDNGQTEQFFNLFSLLVEALKKSGFEYAAEILPVEYFLRQFNDKFEQVITRRWLIRIGLSEMEIDTLSIETKEHFYDNVKLIYQLQGSKKVRFSQRKNVMAVFEPRKILSVTAEHIENFDAINVIWKQLFKVNRSWGAFTFADAKPYIQAYQQSIIKIINELDASKEVIADWKQRSKAIILSERNEPGADFFYGSERFFASEEVLTQINSGRLSWRKISRTAEISISKLADHGIVP